MAPMVHKYYSAEFRADAVALYCSDPALTYAQVARDLGMHAELLRQWVRAAGAAPGPDGVLPAAAGSGAAATPEERIARLEAENAALRAENTGLRKDRETLSVERDILRKATKYFASETSWRGAVTEQLGVMVLPSHHWWYTDCCGHTGTGPGGPGCEVRGAPAAPRQRQRRLYLATEAKALGHGGAKAVARLAEVSESPGAAPS